MVININIPIEESINSKIEIYRKKRKMIKKEAVKELILKGLEAD